MRNDGWMMRPDPAHQQHQQTPPPDVGFDDAHFGGGSRATRVGVGGMREKPHKNTVFTVISAFFSVCYCLGAAGQGC